MLIADPIKAKQKLKSSQLDLSSFDKMFAKLLVSVLALHMVICSSIDDYDDNILQHAIYHNYPSSPRSIHWGTIQYVGTQFPNSVIVSEYTTYNYNGCVGVPISKQHVLISKACYLNLDKKLVAVAAGAVNWSQENMFRDIKKVDSFGRNLLVVTLENKIEEDITVYSLPRRKLQQGASYRAFGWTSVCVGAKVAPNVFKKDVLIVDTDKCTISDDNLACGEDISSVKNFMGFEDMSERYYYFGAGSPVIKELTIYGFTDFGCSKIGSIDEVFPFTDSIKTLIGN